MPGKVARLPRSRGGGVRGCLPRRLCVSPSCLFKLQIKRLDARPAGERQSGLPHRPAGVRLPRGASSGRAEPMAGGAAPTPGALLCALLWAAAAAGGGPGSSPAPGAFGRVYRGAVNISAERVYAFAYSSEPGQVGASPGAPASPRRGSAPCPPRPPSLRRWGRGWGGGAASAAAAPLLCGSAPGSPSAPAVLAASSRSRGGGSRGAPAGFPGTARAARGCGARGWRRPRERGAGRRFGAPPPRRGFSIQRF